MNDSDDQKPRPSHWFKPGQSGNPSGRRRSNEALASDVVEVFGTSSRVQIGDKYETLPTMEQIFLGYSEKALNGSNKHLKILIETMLTLKPPPGKMTEGEEQAAYKWAQEEFARKLRLDRFPERPTRLPKEVRDMIKDRDRRAKLELARRKKERAKETSHGI